MDIWTVNICVCIIFFDTDSKSNSNNSIKDNNNKKHIQSWIFLLNAKWDDLCLARRHQRLCCALWSEQWKSQAMSTLWGEPGFFRGWSSLAYISLAEAITTPQHQKMADTCSSISCITLIRSSECEKFSL